MPLVQLKRRGPFGTVNSPLSHRYRLPNGASVPSVTEVLSDVGLGLDTTFIPKDKLLAKTQIGTMVHDEIAHILKGGEPRHFENERVMAYLTSWKEWYRQQEPFEILACETSMVTNEIAGTVDLIVRLQNGLIIIFDWKTSRYQYYHRFQLMGYAYLAAVTDAITDFRMEDAAKAHRVIVYLQEDKKAREKRYTADDFCNDFQGFNAAITLWHARANKGALPWVQS